MDLENTGISLSLDAPETPALTLDPTGEDVAAKAAEEAAAKEAAEKAAAEKAAAEKAAKEAEVQLTAEEEQMVNAFAEKIDFTNTQQMLQYGAGSQKKISEFSELALNKVRTKDLGEVGDMVTDLVGELKDFEVGKEEPKGLFGFFKKKGDEIAELKTRYDSAESNVNRITTMLEAHQAQLFKDIAMLDKMYEMNMTYYKELTMYIMAGKKKLETFRNTELKAALEKANASGLPQDAQAARDLNDKCDRFEKKLYDLQLTRTISIQMSPQIRLIQGNDGMMAEKIQSTIINTIPLWKNQMVLALGLAHSKAAMESQRAVTDMTNDLLLKNADALKMGTIETAKEAQRGIVDLETLQSTNKSLIETLDELNKIQTEGRTKRANAEVELGKIETELKQKMLELNK